MIKKILVNSLLLSGAALSLDVYALEVVGTKEANTLAKQPHSGLIAPQEVPVTLMKVKLSKEEIAALKKSTSAAPKNTRFARKALPDKVELNVAKFPVLNQGSHGSCVTFASTAALNYVLDKPETERVSPLCSLSLGKTLAESGYYPSGWEGSFGSIVLDQFMRFGYVTMSSQTKNGCAGKYEYPVNNARDEGSPMSLPAYKKQSKSLVFQPLSINTGSRVYWSPILTIEQRFDLENSGESYDGEKVLLEVKQALLNNNSETRNIVTIGTMLYGDLCHAGACATRNAQDDTWAMSSDIKRMLQMGYGPDAGHEITIIGYDDNATAVDRNGYTHKGLLTIRNSWGASTGDKGNYYMTYDYFKVFVDEVQKVSKVVVTMND